MASAEQVSDIIGGPTVLGGRVRSGLDLAAAVRRGLPIGTVDCLLGSGRLTRTELDRVVLPRKTLVHRRAAGTLTAEQSDRLVRVARVMAVAEETFGDRGKAATWLRRPTSILSGEAPLDLLDTEEGAREVESLLGRIAHGIAA